MFNYISRRSGQGGAQRNDPGRNANGAPPMHELGAMLRKRREAMGATLAEVETATKIRQKYLAALEADEWQLLPGEVVGRGFLRNYATYLGLDANELIERRRAVADPSLALALAGTSAASALPPQRPVDYRPKDVPLHEEEEGIEQRREVRPGPFLATAGVVLLLILLIWGVTVFGGRLLSGVGGLFAGAQEWAGSVLNPATATPTEAAPVVVAADNIPTFTPTPETDGQEGATNPDVETTTPAGESAVVDLVPTPTPNAPVADEGAAPPPPVQPEDPAEQAAPPADVAPPPTDTPTPEPPTPTDTPEAEPPTPTPTDTPEETPTPEPPVVVAPACPDVRSVISAPGVNAIVSGNVSVTGQATHEVFEYYKLEYAPGANAADGFFYFGGANSQVEGGLLGTFSSGAVANGVYTIRLTVVDQTGNFPPPCQVTVTVQN
jgi:cytoskeletal protein RodZ